LARRCLARTGVVNGRDKQLRYPAKDETRGEHDTATTIMGDESTVEENSNDGDAVEDARVLKGVADAGHLEEISAVCYMYSR